MKCLTPSEIAEWIRQAGQIEDPHHANYDIPNLIHAQYYSPTKYLAVECFVRRYLDEIVIKGDLLFQLVDWYTFEDSRKIIFEALWKLAGETRSIENVPGCEIVFEQREQAIALYSLSWSFGWQSYIYSEHEQMILYNWEGEIFDMWTCSAQKMKQLQELVQLFELTAV